jgi:ComF family protein
MTFLRLVSSAADLLWAPRCAACDAPVGHEGGDVERAVFCEPCLVSLDRAWSPRCPRCGLSFDAGAGDRLCGRCLAQPPPFESLVARYAYGGALSSAISRFKYAPAPWLAAPLARLLFEAYAPGAPVDVIVPVPLHPRRLRERGFNQASLLACRGTRSLGAPLDTGILRRVVDTPHQAGMSAAQRLEALEGAFRTRPRRRLLGARVLLVDDVATTTATVRAAAAALVAGGARSVEVLCLARTMQ